MGDIGFGQGKLGAVLLDCANSRCLQPGILFQSQIARGPKVEKGVAPDPNGPSGKALAFGV